jgi:hypothetical protein
LTSIGLRSGIRPAQSHCVAAYVFLGIGLVCALIGRILLIGGAFSVSVWWGLGVFLPFGPMLFRLNHTDVAPSSRYFRLAVLPCLLTYFLFQPSGFSKLYRHDILKSAQASPVPANHYGLEQISRSALEQRLVANEREFQRLNAWSEALRLKKRDLLRSDVQGNVAYQAERAQFEAALAKANAEKKALFGSTK